MTKTRFFVTPLSFDTQLLRNPLEYLHEPYTTWKQTPWATFLPLMVCVYLLSNFCGGLRKKHNWRRAVRIDPSRSSEVDDFRVIWKGLCDFLLVINSNLSSDLSPFLRYDDLSVENRQFSLHHLCSTPNLKLFPSLAIRKISVIKCKDIGLINHVIKFHLAQRMWSQSINVTDRQTPYDGNTAPML